MANKHQVIELNRIHPDWTPSQIAVALGCLPEYVRATARRNDLRLGRVHNGPSRREMIIAAERERCASLAERHGYDRLARLIREDAA